MTQSRWQTWASWWQECGRLLYWAYFKPFTLADHLRSIHPKLRATSSPYRLIEEFSTIRSYSIMLV